LYPHGANRDLFKYRTVLQFTANNFFLYFYEVFRIDKGTSGLKSPSPFPFNADNKKARGVALFLNRTFRIIRA